MLCYVYSMQEALNQGVTCEFKRVSTISQHRGPNGRDSSCCDISQILSNSQMHINYNLLVCLIVQKHSFISGKPLPSAAPAG